MQAEVERRKRELTAEIVEPAMARARGDRPGGRGRARAGWRRWAPARPTRCGPEGLAEAEAMAAKAESWKGYNEAAITDRVLEILPELAAAVSAPLAQTEKIVMIGGNGTGPGAHKITRDVTQVMAELPAVVEALTGKSSRTSRSGSRACRTEWPTPRRRSSGDAAHRRALRRRAGSRGGGRARAGPGARRADGGLQVHRPARHVAAPGPLDPRPGRGGLRRGPRLRRLLDPRVPGDRGVGHGAAARSPRRR